MIQQKQVVLSTGARFAEGVDIRVLFNFSEVVCLLHEHRFARGAFKRGYPCRNPEILGIVEEYSFCTLDCNKLERLEY